MKDLGVLISLSRRIVWMTASRKLEEAGYSMTTWAVLAPLVKLGPTSQRDIAAGIGLHPAGVSRLIDDLEGEGLVRRRRDEQDRRRAFVEATPRGKAIWTAAEPLVAASLKDVLSPLSVDEQRQLRKLLRKLVMSDQILGCDPRLPQVLRSMNGRSANGSKKTARKSA